MLRVAALALLVAGCSAREDAQRGDVAEVAPTRPAAPSALQPISRAEFESRLSPGAGCHVQQLDDLMLVAVVGDAVAKIDGDLVDLTGAGADYDALVASRRFEGGGYAIEIIPDTTIGEGDSAGGVSTKPVIVTLARDGVMPPSISAAWVCAS